jgi:hypothetical protein
MYWLAACSLQLAAYPNGMIVYGLLIFLTIKQNIMEPSHTRLLSHAHKVMLAIFSLFITAVSFAQDKKIDVNISTDKGGGFMGSPWLWVVGIAVFVLLLVALLRGNSRRGA